MVSDPNKVSFQGKGEGEREQEWSYMTGSKLYNTFIEINPVL